MMTYFAFGDWTPIINIFEDAYNFSCQPDSVRFPKYKVGDIIDEEKSVRWNREQVEAGIDRRRKEINRLNTVKNNKINYAASILIKAIKDELIKNRYFKTMSSEEVMKKAELIYKKAYAEGHSSGIREIIVYVTDYVNFIEDILN